MLPRQVRVRAEMALSVLAAALGAVTIVRRDWLEVVFGVDPDGGSGETEWLIVAACFALSVVLVWLARRDARAFRPRSHVSRRPG
jgi:hypothetical protein